MNRIKELKFEVANSLFRCPCTEEKLSERDFLKTTSFYGISRLIHMLEMDGAVYYKDNVVHIYKDWATKHLLDR